MIEPDDTPSYDEDSIEGPEYADDSAAAPEQPGGIGRWLVETAFLVAVAFVLAQGIKAFVVQPFVIPTGSMIPTIAIGDRILAEKISYRLREPEIGEVVVFKDPTGQHDQLIKRIIAMEGQTVDIRGGEVYIDGVRTREEYTHGKPTEIGTIPMPIKIPEGSVWLMGDNRPNSGDARFFGPQPLETIEGRALFTYWPPSSWGPLE